MNITGNTQKDGGATVFGSLKKDSYGKPGWNLRLGEKTHHLGVPALSIQIKSRE